MQLADDTRAEIERNICAANESAKRMHDSPKYWTRCHERLDLLLTDWQAVAPVLVDQHVTEEER